MKIITGIETNRIVVAAERSNCSKISEQLFNCIDLMYITYCYVNAFEELRRSVTPNVAELNYCNWGTSYCNNTTTSNIELLFNSSHLNDNKHNAH